MFSRSGEALDCIVNCRGANGKSVENAVLKRDGSRQRVRQNPSAEPSAEGLGKEIPIPLQLQRPLLSCRGLNPKICLNMSQITN